MSPHTQREILVDNLFPEGIPRLWCPALSHFQADGSIDAARTERHLAAVAPYAKGIMVPGSTGEGWDMTDAQIRELLVVVLRSARELGLRVLIGVLRKELDQMLAVIEGTISWLCDETGQVPDMAAMLASNVVGFTVCPPSGSNLSPDQMHDSLSAVLELGHPTALYQLPQVTENEMSPECVTQLAASYPNFYLLKDTSGTDRIALAGHDLHGVFLVRGAEGQYHSWLRVGGGPYDGYLLSSANCFAQQLMEVMELANSRIDDAVHLAQRIENVIECCFTIVNDFPASNPFANGNKIIDHVLAWGDKALSQPPPYLSGGDQLPMEFVDQALQVLEQQQLLPQQGYL
jgi:dihydrodipicolinate synthase/N-acetylneuraminate lyase